MPFKDPEIRRTYNRRYATEHRDKKRAYNRHYHAEHREELLKSMKCRNSTPEAKARNRARQKTLEYREWEQVYRRKPGVRERTRARDRARNKTPKRREQNRVRGKTPERKAWARDWAKQPKRRAYARNLAKTTGKIPKAIQQSRVAAKRGGYIAVDPTTIRPLPTDGLCQHCSKPPGKRKGLHLDHDHITGQFRGWLCGRCNMAFAAFGDSLAGLQHAIAYLSGVHFSSHD